MVKDFNTVMLMRTGLLSVFSVEAEVNFVPYLQQVSCCIHGRGLVVAPLAQDCIPNFIHWSPALPDWQSELRRRWRMCVWIG